MQFKAYNLLYFILTIWLITSCKTPIEPDFSFSPEMPKAGEKVVFTNLTESGELWDWSYGDGAKSRLKSPTYIYKKPGEYDISLMVDSNKNYVRTKKITVYDTIPSIYIKEEKVQYYQKVTFNALVYNPYGYEVDYQWSFSPNANSEDIVDGTSTASSLKVFFNQTEVEETVNLMLTVGDSIYQISKTFFVEDYPARSMVMAQKNGKILRKRMYVNGFEQSNETAYQSGKHPFTIQVQSNKLYVFDAGTHVGALKADIADKAGDGSIRKIDFETGEEIEIINNSTVGAEYGFYNGFSDGTNIYWTDFSNFIYKTPDNNTILGNFEWRGSTDAQTEVPYYFVTTNRLGYVGKGMNGDQLNGGIWKYDDVFFWAKGGLGKGIYKFTQSDILDQNADDTTPSPALGSMLTDYSIRSFTIDAVNSKIYFSVTAPTESIGFWVAKLDGSGAERIDDAPMGNPIEYITGIVIDYITDKVYWSYIAPETYDENYFQENPTHRSGVKSVHLSKHNYTDKKIQYFAPDVEVWGISMDESAK